MGTIFPLHLGRPTDGQEGGGGGGHVHSASNGHMVTGQHAHAPRHQVAALYLPIT